MTDKEINELHLIIDRILEASGYDKNISTAEDFEDVYTDIDYKLGLLDELKQECKKLKEQLQANQPTGICETCMAKVILQNDKYREALDEIEKCIKEYVDNKELYNRRLNKILDIINKAREGNNE